MKKSKKLYIIVLILLLGVALIDHMQFSRDNHQITLGESEEHFTTNFLFALFTK